MIDVTKCPYIPTQGANKNVQCLLPNKHGGAHIHDPAKMPHLTDDGEVSGFTHEEIADAISEDEIQRRAEALGEAQDVWDRAAYRAHPKLPCPECTGNGAVHGGTLGDHCPSCHGSRVVEDDSVDVDFPMPNFRELRDPLNAYGDALIARRYGRPMALPPASTVPTMEAIEQLRAAGKAKHKELAAGGAGPALQLPPAGRVEKSGFDTEGGIDETADDAEIDAIEAEFASEHPPRGRR